VLFLIAGGVLGALFHLACALVWYLVRRREIQRARSGARFVLRTVAGALFVGAVTASLVTPVLLGMLFPTRLIGTRPDERGYLGPKLDAAGAWVQQSRESLAADRRERVRDPGAPEPEPRFAVDVTSADGVRIRTYRVPARGEARFRAVCTHGLFRCALEIEPVGAMFRDLGAEVWLVEMRNHGGSGRATFGFGLREAGDVSVVLGEALAADPSLPVIAFGVSLGSVATAFAVEGVEGLPPAAKQRLRGVVLDSPIAELGRVARERLETFLPWPAPGLFLGTMQWQAGIDLERVKPGDALAAFPDDLPVLVIAGSDDHWVGTEILRRFASRAPRPAEGSPWIAGGIGHGRVWMEAAESYRDRLAAFVDACLDRPR
jgi:alpha-beta hydrolase superfamily lysophospholipase